MDEGVVPHDPFPEGPQAQAEEAKAEEPKTERPKAVVSQAIAAEAVAAEVESPPLEPGIVAEHTQQVRPVVSQKFEKPVFKAPAPEPPGMGAFLSQTDTSARFGSWKLFAVIAAVALIVGVIAVPWGWYARSKATKLTNEAQSAPLQTSQPAAQTATANETPVAPVASESVVPQTSSEEADLAAKHQREARAAKERAAKAQEIAAGPGLSPPASAPVNAPAPKIQSSAQSSPAPGSKKATVQVTYDENGRVTQASGGDATALRIARQKRFPAGKAGSATITIPIN
jgi:hypothetical protein